MLSGSLDIIVSNGNEQKKFSLNRSFLGLYIDNGIWRHMENFSTNALVLVISNTSFDKNDYIRDFDKFKCIQKNVKK